MEINDKLKNHRRNKGLSQEDLAKNSGISIRTIQRIEKGLSIGSAYTLTTLAKALQIDLSDLLPDKPKGHLEDTDLGQLKLLNLSAISVLVLPLTNIIIPGIILWKNRNDKTIAIKGRRILTFQILWTLATIFMMAIVPFILLFVFHSLVGSKIPLFVPVYFICVFVNIYCIVRLAISLSNQSDLIEKLPNIL